MRVELMLAPTVVMPVEPVRVIVPKFAAFRRTTSEVMVAIVAKALTWLTAFRFPVTPLVTSMNPVFKTAVRAWKLVWSPAEAAAKGLMTTVTSPSTLKD